MMMGGWEPVSLTCRVAIYPRRIHHHERYRRIRAGEWMAGELWIVRSITGKNGKRSRRDFRSLRGSGVGNESGGGEMLEGWDLDADQTESVADEAPNDE